MKIAFIGLGLMGLPMAERLLAAGHELSVWNRTPGKASALGKKATSHDSAGAAIDGCDVAITMLATGEAVQETLFASNAVAQLRENALVIDMSSIPPKTARHHSIMVRERGGSYLDAPVSGGTRGAAEGTLTIFVGGPRDAYERALPILSQLGKPHHMGDTGSGQLAKLSNQIIVAGTLMAVAEGFAFADQAGLNLHALRKALSGGFADSRIVNEHGLRMADRNFAPGAPNSIFLKDIRAIEAVSSELGMDTPITRQAVDFYSHLVSAGLANLDHSSVICEYLPQWMRDLDPN